MPILGKSKKEVVQEFRSAEILEAARRVFAGNGYNAATVDEIAEMAGVAKGTVYLYFPSKQDLFLAALRSGVRELHEQVHLEVTAADTTADRVRAFMAARLRYGVANRDFIRIYYTEFTNMQFRSSASRVEFQDLYDNQARLLESVLEAGVRSGELRPLDTKKAAHLIFEMARASIAKHILEWPDEPIESTVQLLFDLVWSGIGCARDK